MTEWELQREAARKKKAEDKAREEFRSTVLFAELLDEWAGDKSSDVSASELRSATEELLDWAGLDGANGCILCQN